jgi:hypothetical protein
MVLYIFISFNLHLLHMKNMEEYFNDELKIKFFKTQFY